MIYKDRFKDKRAVITGAGKGIGKATALRMAAEGGKVALIGRTLSNLEVVAQEIRAAGGTALAIQADVSQEAEIRQAIQQAVDAWGGLDIVVSNAGIELPCEDSKAHSLPLDVWNKILTINLTGQFLTCKHGIQQLLEGGGGAVVMVGSNCGWKGFCVDEHAYSVSKGGIEALMKSMAIDYARDNIRVNACIPGFIDTPMNAHVMGDEEQLKFWSGTIPINRPGTAEETAAVILFLASDDASYCVGSSFCVDGGQRAS